MKISIAMCTFNGGIYLQQQLDSFSHQTRLPDDLVVCDDGSTDNTIAILEQFKAKAKFPVYIVQNPTNIGYAQNFSKVIDLCQGDIIFLSDQDDMWLPEKLATVCEIFMNQPDTLVVINDQIITDSELVSTGLTKLHHFRSIGMGYEHFVTGCCTAFRTSIKPLVLPIPVTSSTHDIWLHMVISEISEKYVLEKPLQLYRRHTDNASNGIISSTVPVTRSALRKFKKTINMHKVFEERVSLLKILVQRLKAFNQKDFIAFGSSKSLNVVTSMLNEKITAFEHRQEIHRSSYMARKGLALSMYKRGEYKYFSGLLSFLKDILL